MIKVKDTIPFKRVNILYVFSKLDGMSFRLALRVNGCLEMFQTVQVIWTRSKIEEIKASLPSIFIRQVTIVKE